MPPVGTHTCKAFKGLLSAATGISMSKAAFALVEGSNRLRKKEKGRHLLTEGIRGSATNAAKSPFGVGKEKLLLLQIHQNAIVVLQRIKGVERRKTNKVSQGDLQAGERQHFSK